MLNPYILLENVLIEIENNLKEEINVDILSKTFGLSSTHLQRLFKFAFKKTIADYIRSRRLTASLEDLFKSNLSILNIALEYGFKYEQSYIRAVKNEFGLTPGKLRKSGEIVKITPPIHLFDSNRLDSGALFGPEIVLVPKFHIIGKRHRVPIAISEDMAPNVGKHFWMNERKAIKNTVNPNVYIGFTRAPPGDADFSYYLPSVQVKENTVIPAGYETDTFETSFCAKFRYIGQHHYYDINRKIAGEMYQAIGQFFYDYDKGIEQDSTRSHIYFERIDTSAYDGTYCLMEWFAPVYEKPKK